mmetsp:Transcript_89205/g.266067  ORF Transcript_89205/g.266067 Transcript_89205/m.266067 type:complete len:228 (-) Transcript_89205:18-701(-)
MISPLLSAEAKCADTWGFGGSGAAASVHTSPWWSSSEGKAGESCWKASAEAGSPAASGIPEVAVAQQRTWSQSDPRVAPTPQQRPEGSSRPLNPHAQEWQPPGKLDSRIRGAQSRAAAKQRPAGAAWRGSTTPMSPEDLLGAWADSLGNAVLVSSVDAYELHLLAVLSQPPRQDIQLNLRPVPGGGWICGNAMLDPSWSLTTQLHWVTSDGRISVWVRLQGDAQSAK